MHKKTNWVKLEIPIENTVVESFIKKKTLLLITHPKRTRESGDCVPDFFEFEVAWHQDASIWNYLNQEM